MNNTIERRRLQNRIAQRKFRQKRNRAAAASQIESSTSSSSIAGSGTNRSSTSPSQLDTPITVEQSDATAVSSPNLGDVNFWDLNAIDGFISGVNTSESVTETDYFRSLDFTAPSPAQTSPTTALDSSFFPRHCALLPPPSTSTQSAALKNTPSAILPYDGRDTKSLDSPSSSTRSTKNDIWLSTLHIAVQNGHDRIVRRLIQRNNVDCNEKDSAGRTPLLMAVIEGHEDIVNSLLSCGANINEVDGERRSALHLAALHQREHVLRVLLEHCAHQSEKKLDIDAYDDSGMTPLHVAVDRGFESGVDLLLQNGANLNFKARKTWCPP
ncbi:ankyrin repeat protein [Rutstroemia sp. NJR-2017a WRK4]|nr:ankyrin repeat protein [Rutstroemia sp. NJR-2017a WRK4]